MKAKRSSRKPIAKVGKRRVSIPGPKKAPKAVFSSKNKKKQSAKFPKIPTVKTIKKYVKKQIKSSFISPKTLSFPNALVGNPDKIMTGPPIPTILSGFRPSETSVGTKTFGGDNFEMSSTIPQKSQHREIFVDDTTIPTSYEKTWVALIVKDPHWVYATWEIAQNSLQPFLSHLDDPPYPARIVLRVYDVTCIQFDGGNANYYFDLEVGCWTNNWYINLWRDHASYCAEIGVRAFDGKFTPLARSNFVQTPRAGYSWRTEEIWIEVKDHKTQSPYVLVRIPRHNASGHQSRNGSSKTIRRKFYLTPEDIRGYYAQLMPFLKKVLSTRLNKRDGKRGLKRYRYVFEENDLARNEIYRLAGEEFGEAMTVGASEILIPRRKRGALGSSEYLWASQPLEKKQRNFFFEIWADVIVYGRTESDAEVWLGKQKIPLRLDGTFTLRYTLPDTTMPFPFTAVSGDQVEKRSITTVVNRRTNQVGSTAFHKSLSTFIVVNMGQGFMKWSSSKQ